MQSQAPRARRTTAGDRSSATAGRRLPASHARAGAVNPAFGRQMTDLGSTPSMACLNMYFRVVRLSLRPGGIRAERATTSSSSSGTLTSVEAAMLILSV
jgi:hypothetical protein